MGDVVGYHRHSNSNSLLYNHVSGDSNGLEQQSESTKSILRNKGRRCQQQPNQMQKVLCLPPQHQIRRVGVGDCKHI